MASKKKKKIKTGRIEPSSNGIAIVVHFTTETSYFDEHGIPTRVDKVPDTKEISLEKSLRGLREQDIPGLAQDIADRCKYITSSKVRQLEQVIAKLYTGRGYPCNGHAANGRRSSSLQVPQGRYDSDGGHSPSPSSGSASVIVQLRPTSMLPQASLEDVDEYADELYEDSMELKAQGALRILRLCAEGDGLDIIANHSSLLGLLARELRENAKRSHELAVAICGVFLCLAHFSQFHEALQQHQCTDVTLRVVEYESRRRVVLSKELELSRGRIVAQGSVASDHDRRQLEREEDRYRLVLDRQDRLLQLCLLVLRDLCEDTSVQKKLLKHKIGGLLLPLLQRSCEELLFSVLTFLQRLVIFDDTKSHMAQHVDSLQRLAELAGHGNTEISHLALRVCYNLAFDARARAVMASQVGLIGKLMVAINQQHLRRTALMLLYQMSTDTAVRGIIAERHPECVLLACEFAARGEDRRVPPDRMALCINLVTDSGCAAAILEAPHFPTVAKRAVRNADPLLLKVMRHIASHEGVRLRLLEVVEGLPGGGTCGRWLRDLARAAITCSDDQDVLVEALGTLAALDSVGDMVPWAELCEAGLLELLHRLLIVGFSEDDVLLECIMLVGNIAMDASTESLVAASRIPTLLSDILQQKHEDEEMLAQLLHVLRCLLLWDETREAVLKHTDAPELVMDVLRKRGRELEERHPTLRAMAEEILDTAVAAESCGDEPLWADRIKAFRFEYHNVEWCEYLRAGGSSDEADARSHVSSPVNYRRWQAVGDLGWSGSESGDDDYD